MVLVKLSPELLLRCFRPYSVWTSFFTSSAATNCKEEKTHFGYQSIKKEEKSEKVHKVFSNVASKYDLMNDVMSIGIHRLWKDRLIRVLNPNEKTILLDCAGGTGDIAFRSIRYVSQSTSISPDVTVCDLNQEMLNIGQQRAVEEGFDLKWVCGNAEELPFPDKAFNAFTISFGIRNCTNIDKVLNEAHRVLSPGGRFLCLEFGSDVTIPGLKSLYDAYTLQLLPVIGEVVAGDWKSYQYLAESMRRFPRQIEFAQMIQAAGFKEVSYENLSLGICAIHSGFKF